MEVSPKSKLDIYPACLKKKVLIWKDKCKKKKKKIHAPLMFTTALFTTAKTWKYKSLNRWMDKEAVIRHTHTHIHTHRHTPRNTTGLQYVRPPCPSPTPRVYSNSCLLMPLIPSNHLILCHPLLPSPSIFPSISVFSKESALRIQSTGASASTSVLPLNIQDCLPLGWTGWISLQSKGLSRVFSNTTVQKHQFFTAQLPL